MEAHIFDVEHGSCAAVIAPSGNILLIDSGHNDTTGWRPYCWINDHGGTIAEFVASNFDEDHLSDFPNVRQWCEILSFTVNWTLSPQWVRQAKSANRLGHGVAAIIDMMEKRPGYDPQNPLAIGSAVPVDWGRCRIVRYYHSSSIFSDLNSLSVVVFVQYGGIRIVFPGDLTVKAWSAFLSSDAFRDDLRLTNIFIASHHGRKDGYCPDVFKICQPALILISDKTKVHATQQVDYSQHATGINWNNSTTRYCLTTRNDGNFRITPSDAGSFYVQSY